VNDHIAGKVVVITGASSGLGETAARHLAGLGAKVVLGARRQDRLHAIAGDIAAAGGEAAYRAADVSRQGDVEALVQLGISQFGRIDVLISNAGLMSIAPLAEARVDEWERMIDVNIKGVLYGIASALPVFQRQGSGHFIHIASVAGLKVFSPGGTVYSGTKFAVRAISEGLRHEVGGAIRTTIVSPGAVESELRFGTSHPESAKALSDLYQIAISSDTVAQAIAFAIGQPNDVDVNEIVLRPTIQDF
jgi:NADP-dependent 3-hydroxy acid dehydrogenase YdfG